MQVYEEEVQQSGHRMKWTPELNKCVMCCHFHAVKSRAPVGEE